MKRSILIFFIICLLPAFGQQVKTEIHSLEGSKVKLQLEQYGTKADKAVFINVHENESTSTSAVRQYLKNRNGYFIAIKQNGKRNLGFKLKGVRFQFDPNRMFTKAGRIANLKLLNKKYIDAAEETVEEFSDKIISKIRSAKIVVAVHNNTNNAPLTVNSYKNNYRNASMDVDDFVLTTSKVIFDRLKAKKINAVWETTSTSVDDGSLAYYCSQKNIPYINVEAQQGHKSEQLRMLNAITDIVNAYSK